MHSVKDLIDENLEGRTAGNTGDREIANNKSKGDKSRLQQDHKGTQKTSTHYITYAAVFDD